MFSKFAALTLRLWFCTEVLLSVMTKYSYYAQTKHNKKKKILLETFSKIGGPEEDRFVCVMRMSEAREYWLITGKY